MQTLDQQSQVSLSLCLFSFLFQKQLVQKASSKVEKLSDTQALSTSFWTLPQKGNKTSARERHSFAGYKLQDDLLVFIISKKINSHATRVEIETLSIHQRATNKTWDPEEKIDAGTHELISGANKRIRPFEILIARKDRFN